MPMYSNGEPRILVAPSCCILSTNANGWKFGEIWTSPTRHWRIMLEQVADSARKAVKLAEPYEPYGGQFLKLTTYQTCMKLTRKSTEFCQFFCRHYPIRKGLSPTHIIKNTKQRGSMCFWSVLFIYFHLHYLHYLSKTLINDFLPCQGCR